MLVATTDQSGDVWLSHESLDRWLRDQMGKIEAMGDAADDERYAAAAWVARDTLRQVRECLTLAAIEVVMAAEPSP